MPSVFRLSFVAVAAFVLAGCGARAKHAASPAEAPDYDWSHFGDGKVDAPSAAAKQEKAPAAKQEKDAEPQPEKSDKEASATKDAAKPAAPEAPKKISATKIAGLSVSEVSADLVAAATQRATNRSLVSTSVIVGAEYEQVSIMLDHLAVQIVRPASSPDKSGPKVRSPKARKKGVAQTEATIYDAKADVLVLVQADKKATSARALAALVSGSPTAAPAAKKPARATKPKRAS